MTIPQKIKEEDGTHKEWYGEAQKQTMETLPEFMRKLSEDYVHDYGTICHALAASAIAAATAMNKSPQGGITGFQARAVMWQFIKGWMMEKGPMQLVRYHDMLYPQYAYKFQQKTITPEIWKDLQTLAKEKVASANNVHPEVMAHWASIVMGHVPFGYKVEEEE